MRVKDKVERLLLDNPDYRNSDKKLLLAYWETQGLHLTEAQRDKFFQCTIAESITRARRDLRGKYPASDAVEQARQQKARQYKHTNSPRAISWLNDEPEGEQ